MIGAAYCTAHRGQHGVYEGRCFIPAREQPQLFRWRFTSCPDCGMSLDLRYERGERRPVVLEAGTNTVHRCRRPSVDLDAGVLAEAIVTASRAARQERAPQRQEAISAPIDPQSPMSGHERAADGYERALPSVQVWGDDGAGG